MIGTDMLKITLTLPFLFLASIEDLKKREVWDWLSFTFIFTSLIFVISNALLYSDIHILIRSFFGFLFSYLISLLLYYTGQWGGGDAKLLIGLGILYGLDFKVIEFYNINILEFFKKINIITFFVLTILIGSIYSIIYCLILIIKKPKEFAKMYKKLTRKYNYLRIAFYITSSLLLLFALVYFSNPIKLVFIIISMFIIIAFNLMLMLKSVENGIMIKKCKINQITEGDWVLDTIRIENKDSFIDKVKKQYELFYERKIRKEKIIKIFARKVLIRKFGLIRYLIFNLFKKQKIFEVIKRVETALSSSSFKNIEKEIRDILQEVIDENYLIVYEPQYNGITKSQIKMIKELINKKILKDKFKVKYGIPFVPSFFVANLTLFFIHLF